MATFEHAIFTSACTARGEGYHLTGRSSGIGDELARELSRWGPSHECLAEPECNRRSINFCKLSDGSFCASTTAAAGMEHSGRAGERMLTHSLIGSPAALLEFANDPFAVLFAADAMGVFDSEPKADGTLSTVCLSGQSSPVDSDLLARAAARFDVDQFARVMTACTSATPVAIAGSVDLEFLLRALLHCLPVASRANLSFSTALKPSPRRPFRIITAPASEVERHRLHRQFGMVVVDVEASSKVDTSTFTKWSSHVADCLRDGKVSQLVEDIESYTEPVPDAGATGGLSASADTQLGQSTGGQAASGTRESVSSAEASATSTLAAVEASHGEVVDRLGLLDDVVLEAISGKADAFERLRRLWPQLCEGLDSSLIEESREQYLRYAVQKWREQSGEASHDPNQAVALLDIIGLLFGSA